MTTALEGGEVLLYTSALILVNLLFIYLFNTTERYCCIILTI